MGTTILTAAAFGVAALFALNIGASGTAAAMATAYGSGAIRNRLLGVLLVAAAVFLGAVTGGAPVVKTIGGRLIPASLDTLTVALIILSCACATLLFANLTGIPLSTSEVTVGAIVGVGISYQSVSLGTLLVIVLAWIALPVLAFGISYSVTRLTAGLDRRVARWDTRRPAVRVVSLALVAGGCYEAFSAGMNNVANAAGPIVGAGLIDAPHGIVLGAIFVAAGAVLLGRRVLETNAKKITEITLVGGTIVSATGGSLVVGASLLGLPVPLTQTTTTAIFGVALARRGRAAFDAGLVRRIVRVWAVSPLVSLALAAVVVHVVAFGNWYLPVLAAIIVAATIGVLGFRRAGAPGGAAGDRRAGMSRPPVLPAAGTERRHVGTEAL